MAKLAKFAGEGAAMLAERPVVNDQELRNEFFKMQRAQFIEWLLAHDTEGMREVVEAELEFKAGRSHSLQEVRELMSKRFNG